MFFLNQNLQFCFDPLALFFLGVIALVSFPSFLFSAGYLRVHFSRRRSLLAAGLTVFFVLSMAAVVVSANLIFFLFAWEFMSLISYFLVVFEHEHEASVKAGMIYLVMTHIGTAFLLAAFLLMYARAGTWDFEGIRIAVPAFSPTLKNVLFILFFAGFGMKAGIVPLHIWLPYAHPQAPASVSSIMSGAMIKIAIYGILRFIVGMLGLPPAWWGNAILVLAGISCLVGVIYALMEHDIKKLLAYHSVENIGIILLGVGAGMVFWHWGWRVLACAAFAAGLYHTVNHAVFKGLLFLCSGSIHAATGIKDIEKLGGLIKRMPQTAAAFLVGAMAISALPPLSGFVSEWLIFQVFFAALRDATSGGKLFFAGMMACLALTSGLAAACFVKAFGVAFLAMPRSQAAGEAREVTLSMRSAMAFLAALTIALGLGAGLIWKMLCVIAASFLDQPAPVPNDLLGGSWALIRFPGTGASLSTPMILLALCGGAAAIALVVRLRPRRPVVVKGKTWDCGYYQLDHRTEYTATAFSKPFRIAFSFFLMPYRKTEKIRDSFYHVKEFIYETATTPVFKRYLYDPLVAGLLKLAHHAKGFQMGSIHWYLAYIFVTILTLIVVFGRP
ncbi:MAG: proton-conducting transporter membrane subunit [Candidatus Omnitrophica bacterium]|nr:proton-conducting transporter membrane subunit [Candidatus Omnitrophota bacterium]MDD5573651.1 proton-conducting transporter membrane subunit [Candidatus Omnitrophota bacterium]